MKLMAENATTRERILDAALAAYGTDGYAATSLDALADQLGELDASARWRMVVP